MRMLADVRSLKFFICIDVYFQQLDDTANIIKKGETPQLYGI